MRLRVRIHNFLWHRSRRYRLWDHDRWVRKHLDRWR